jgi:hypothetical protein
MHQLAELDLLQAVILQALKDARDERHPIAQWEALLWIEQMDGLFPLCAKAFNLTDQKLQSYMRQALTLKELPRNKYV